MMGNFDNRNFSLTYLSRFDIENLEEGLSEPSGLALSHGKMALWTISDDTGKIFKLNLNGGINKKKSFAFPEKGLEGIALDPTGEFLFVVKEDNNAVIKIRVDSERVVYKKRITEMEGYEEIALHFFKDKANKGLEGVTWNNETSTVFVMKEGNPGLLIEISSNLGKILSHNVLDTKNGFSDTEVLADEIDFSDICYDHSRDQFWIISDKAKRLFLYDWKNNGVVKSAKLSYGKGGKYREIKKAEGVAIDPGACRLYVVSDSEARLYVYDIR